MQGAALDLTLHVTCDCSAAPSAGLVFGCGWARLVLATPPPADWEAYLLHHLRPLRVLLRCGAGVDPEAPPRIHLAGPDLSDATDLRDTIARAWGATGSSTAVPAGSAKQPKPCSAEGPLTALAATICAYKTRHSGLEKEKPRGRSVPEEVRRRLGACGAGPV
jgi:hypothetical protein